MQALERDEEAPAGVGQASALERLTRLQLLTAALSQAVTSEQAAEAIGTQGLAAFDADACHIYLLSDDGAELIRLESTDRAPEIMDNQSRTPANAPVPAADAVRTGRPAILESPAEQDALYPGQTDRPVIAALPLTVRGRSIGALELRIPAARIFSPEDRAFLLTTADLCAQALARARQYDSERLARERAEREVEQRRRLDGELDHVAQHEFRALVENDPDVVFRLDRDLRHRYINPAIEKATGLSSQFFLGKTNHELGMPADLCVLWETAQREVFQTGQERRTEFAFPSPDGIRHYQSRLVPEFDRDGAVASILGVARDITDRKRLEDELREAEEWLRGSFDYAAVGMALVSPDGRWLKVNRALREIVGYSEQELLSLTFQDLTHPDDLDADLAYARKMLSGEIRYYHMEKRYLHKQGRVVWILLSVSLVHDAAGAPLYFISQIQDITARKKAEKERESLIRQLQEALATVKTLGGLLPICAWCKQIRNDAGYWKNVESYFSEHLDVHFTHSICPACSAKLPID